MTQDESMKVAVGQAIISRLNGIKGFSETLDMIADCQDSGFIDEVIAPELGEVALAQMMKANSNMFRAGNLNIIEQQKEEEHVFASSVYFSMIQAALEKD